MKRLIANEVIWLAVGILSWAVVVALLVGVIGCGPDAQPRAVAPVVVTQRECLGTLTPPETRAIETVKCEGTASLCLSYGGMAALLAYLDELRDYVTAAEARCRPVPKPEPTETP